MSRQTLAEPLPRSREAITRPVRVIAVTSGKGGVGKSCVSINLAAALAQASRQVLLLDASLGLANVDVMLGLQPESSLAQVMTGERRLEEILVGAPGGYRVVPGSAGEQHMIRLGVREQVGLVQAFSELTAPLDVLIIDTAAGLSDSVTTFTRAAQETIVVVCDEPASIASAHALIRHLARDHGHERFRVLANMTHSIREGYELFGKIARAADSLPTVSLDYLGSIPHDDVLRQAVQKQRAVVEASPSSRSAQAFRKLATRIDSWPFPAAPSGQVEFFVERLLGARRDDSGVA